MSEAFPVGCCCGLEIVVDRDPPNSLGQERKSVVHTRPFKGKANGLLMEKSDSGQARRLEGKPKPDAGVTPLDLSHRHHSDPDALGEFLHGPAPFASTHANSGAE